MALTRATDYGVRVMIHLASLPPGTRAGLAELVAAAEVSPSFLAKVMQRLVKARLVVSRRGKRGGFALAADREAVALLDIVNALDGVPLLNVCLLSSGGCDRKTWCAAHDVWQEARAKMIAVLASASLGDLADSTRLRRQTCSLVCGLG